MKAHAFVHRWVDQIKLKEFGVVKNMFKQNMKIKKWQKLINEVRKKNKAKQKKTIECAFMLKRMGCTRDDQIVDFHYPIPSCFWRMISISDQNPILIEVMLCVSENYPKVYCDAQHTFLCCVYFASWGKITAGAILPLAKHDWLK